MKRSLGSSDSLGALMSICPTTEEHSPRNSTHVYSREFQSMLNGLDEEGCVEESGGHVTEKKRRLSGDQVKALEKNFEVENKLEPERKVKLAQELGLQPRQVAVWFQNRRARWKTKQLERDYGLLKASYDSLKHNFDAIQQDKEALLKEIRELKAKLNEENTESNVSVKEEIILAESEDKVTEEDTPPLLDSLTASAEAKELNYENFNSSSSLVVAEKQKEKEKEAFFFFFIICTEMAMNITFQIGALAGTPIQAESITSASTGSDSSAAAAWKTPIPSIRCKIIKPETVEQKSQPTSPCRSPILSGSNGIRPDLSVACRAFATETLEFMTLDESKAAEEEKMYKEGKTEKEKGVPVYVMMPLDSVTMGNTLNRKKAMNASLQALKSAGVEGLMVDVWWGLVERDAPGVYNWGGYTELLEMAKRHGLKVQAVMSFHQCGGNVGDSCTIPLPKWAVEEIDKDQDLAYTDQWGRRNYEYISLGCDTLPALKGRTPVQCYSDFMRAFRDNFKHLLGDTIVEIQVGMGPAGELRYPSYPEQNGTWRFPGIGAFQCYDKYMLSSLKAAAEAAGKPEWGSTGPTDAGEYNNWPEDTQFFRKEGGGWTSPYGEFFLTWYSQMLLDHGERILSSAKATFENIGVKISVKIAGIHWHYGTRSHAPELTAGYYNTRFRDGYLPIARMLARHGAIFNFTCIEMRDHEQPQDALCAPEKLVRQVALATREAGIPLAGENALPRYDEYAHEQILQASSLNIDESSDDKEMCAFTYLRMNPHLFQPDNWRRFVAFVKKMKEGKSTDRCWEEVEREAEHFVHVSQPLVQEAAVALMH